MNMLTVEFAELSRQRWACTGATPATAEEAAVEGMFRRWACIFDAAGTGNWGRERTLLLR